MSGYQTYTRWQRIETRANMLGFRLGNPKHGNWGNNDTDMVSLYPVDDKLPVFSRDAELFCGTFSSIETWLAGWERAQQYDMLLRLSDEKKRAKAEVKEVERQKKEAERLAKRKMYAILTNKPESQVDKLIK